MLHGARVTRARRSKSTRSTAIWPRAGGRFAVASIDDWQLGRPPGTLLPYLTRNGMDTAKIGLMGWSAGGAGALRLAAELGPEQVGAVVAASHTVSAAQAPLRELVDIPVWLGCGDRDAVGPRRARRC